MLLHVKTDFIFFMTHKSYRVHGETAAPLALFTHGKRSVSAQLVCLWYLPQSANMLLYVRPSSQMKSHLL